MRIIFPCFTYDEALVKASLTLSDQRQALTDKLFKEILDTKDSKLRNLLPGHKKLSIIISEGVASSIRFFKTNRFFFFFLRLHDVKNYTLLVTNLVIM